MARNGNGQYTLPAGNPVVPGTTISTDWANNTLNDIATALTGSVASDGQTAMQGNLDMSNNKIVGLTNGTAPQDAATVNQLSNAAITGGTINGASIGLTNPKDGNFLNLTANTGDFSAGLTAVTVTPPSDSSNKVATTEFVQEAIAAVSSGVTSFNGRSGVVTLNSADVNNALGYTPYNAGTNTVVTTANVLDYTVGKTGQGATGNWGISISGNAATANSANSVDSITSNQVSTALGYVPLTPNSPALLGTPTAPTATVGTNTTQIATCAFVLANQGGGGGAVQSVNGKTGAVVLSAADVGAYPNSNPSAYTTLAAVQAQGYTTQAWVQSQGYVTSAALSNYVTTNTAQTITGIKTFPSGFSFTATAGITATAHNFSANTSIAFNPSTSQVQIVSNGNNCAIFGSATASFPAASIAGALNFGTGTTPSLFSTGTSKLQLGTSPGPASGWLMDGISFSLYGAGSNGFKPGGGAWADSSDIRLKDNVQTLTTCLDTINALNPVMFTWKMASKAASGAPEVGFIADEVELVIPSAVCEVMPFDYGDNDDSAAEITAIVGEDTPIKCVGFKNDMFAYLVGAIKELSAQVDTLNTELQVLKNK